jgi:hypothetical protein
MEVATMMRLPLIPLPGSPPPLTVTRHVAKLSLAALLATLLSACKIVVTVPEGGKVVTEDGFVCLAGETCIIEVTDDTFDSTFTAMPDEGYTFTVWAPKDKAFCKYRSTPCHLSTDGFAENNALMNILAGDSEFRLQPVFVGYDLGYWQQTVREIEEGTFATESSLYAATPNVGGCDPGAVKAQVNSRALEATNQTRSLNDLPKVDHDSSYDTQVQEASLVQRANNYLNHFPSPGDACYTANAEDGAATSNLGGGSGLADPAADVFGWTNDNENLAARMEAGHRRWMLFPELGYIAYGQVDGFKALKVFGFGKAPRRPVPPGLEFVAVPYKYYPFPLVSKDPPTPWSLSMVPPAGVDSAFDYFSNAMVEVVEKDTGNSLSIKNLHRDSKRFGLANFLSWDVDGWDYDVEYTVKVSNINLPGGEMKDIEYPVVVDRYHLFDVSHPLESTDSDGGGIMQGNFNTAKDQDSYSRKLKGRYRVSGTSEFSNMGYFIRLYDRGKRLVKSSDQPFEMDFRSGTYTVVVSPCDESGLCYQTTQTYRVTFTGLD